LAGSGAFGSRLCSSLGRPARFPKQQVIALLLALGNSGRRTLRAFPEIAGTLQNAGNRSFNQRGIIPCGKMLPRPKWIVLSSL